MCTQVHCHYEDRVRKSVTLCCFVSIVYRFIRVDKTGREVRINVCIIINAKYRSFGLEIIRLNSLVFSSSISYQCDMRRHFHLIVNCSPSQLVYFFFFILFYFFLFDCVQNAIFISIRVLFMHNHKIINPY